jgi:Cns1/TTC4 Wheel domain
MIILAFPLAGELIFPVLFVYPEHGETDFIEEWRENETFAQHLGN